MLKKIKWIDVRLLLLLMGIIFLYSFATVRNNERKISKTHVEFVGENNPFVTHEMVNNLLIQNFKEASNIRKDRLDLNSLEYALNSHQMIEQAEVYTTIDGTIKAVVKQKTPIARVCNNNGFYYIDCQGEEMPLSDNFAARVPLVSGEINAANRQGLVKVFRKINEDDFLKKNITGIQILTTGSLIMSTRNFKYRVLFGRVINIDKKFKNYKAFYQHAVKDTLIRDYKLINLKFTQQVVCAK